MTRRSKVKVGDAFHIKGFIPPLALQQIAEERTCGMVAAYVHYGARAAHTALLARSCYMQGINDAIDSLHKAGYEIVPTQASMRLIE